MNRWLWISYWHWTTHRITSITCYVRCYELLSILFALGINLTFQKSVVTLLSIFFLYQNVNWLQYSMPCWLQNVFLLKMHVWWMTLYCWFFLFLSKLKLLTSHGSNNIFLQSSQFLLFISLVYFSNTASGSLTKHW